MPLRPALFLFGAKHLRKPSCIELFISMWYNFHINGMRSLQFSLKGCEATIEKYSE